MAYIEGHNQDPTPFVWSAPVERILARIACSFSSDVALAIAEMRNYAQPMLDAEP
jgi:hypothetical protein